MANQACVELKPFLSSALYSHVVQQVIRETSIVRFPAYRLLNGPRMFEIVKTISAGRFILPISLADSLSYSRRNIRRASANCYCYRSSFQDRETPRTSTDDSPRSTNGIPVETAADAILRDKMHTRGNPWRVHFVRKMHREFRTLQHAGEDASGFRLRLTRLVPRDKPDTIAKLLYWKTNAFYSDITAGMGVCAIVTA